MAFISKGQQAVVEAATDAAVAAVLAGDPDQLTAALTDSGAMDKGLWYQYIVSDLLDLVRRNYDLGLDTDPAFIAELLGPPLPDGFWLRARIAAVTGREMSTDETHATVGLGAAAASAAQHLIAEYLLLEHQSPAQQQRYVTALRGLMGVSQQYVAVVVMLAKAIGSAPQEP